MWRSSAVGPLELELELLLVLLPLVLYVELGTGRHVDSLPGNLDLEALAPLQSVGKPSKLRYKLGGGVYLLDVPVWLFAHRCSLGSLTTRPLGILSGPRGTAKSPRGSRLISQVSYFLKLSTWRTSQHSVKRKFIREAHSPSPHGPGPPNTTLDHK